MTSSRAPLRPGAHTVYRVLARPEAITSGAAGYRRTPRGGWTYGGGTGGNGIELMVKRGEMLLVDFNWATVNESYNCEDPTSRIKFVSSDGM